VAEQVTRLLLAHSVQQRVEQVAVAELLQTLRVELQLFPGQIP
jgi:hypothetical protein